jgi:hypothetical protein
MIADILIAIGFFFSGALFGLYTAAVTLIKEEKEDPNKHVVVYEF